METLPFSDHFWGVKHQGYDVLYQNMISGLKASKDFLEYLREIYSMEDNCTKSWSKLLKQINFNSVGTLQPFWFSLKEFSEMRYGVHSDLSQNIQSLIKGVQKYIEEQTIKHKACKEIDIQTQHFNNLMINNTTHLERTKQVYHNRYMELHKLLNDQSNNGTKSREIEKQEVKLKKAVDEYKYLIEKYNNTCTKFKTKMTESSKNFQDIENYHLIQMKDFINKFSTVMRNAQVKLQDQLNELDRKDTKMSVEYLMTMFVRQKTTGTEPPQHVHFEDAEELLTSGKLSTAPANLCVGGTNRSVSSDLSGMDSENGPNSEVAIGNLVNIDSASDKSSSTTNNLPNNVNNIEDRTSECSYNDTISNNTGVNNKKRRYNKIFRRRRNSPVNNSSATNPSNSTNIGQSNTELDKVKNATNEIVVDEEGYSIKPSGIWEDSNHDSTSDSSSDDERNNESGLFKGLKVEIKPHKSTNSESSSIADDITLNPTSKEDELFKAVQGLKINNAFRTSPSINNSQRKIRSFDNSGSRSNTPASQNSKSELPDPKFSVDFNTTLKLEESENDNWLQSKSMTIKPVVDPWGVPLDKDINSNNHAIVSQRYLNQPPPLPAKSFAINSSNNSGPIESTVPLRAASVVPQTHYASNESQFKITSIETPPRSHHSHSNPNRGIVPIPPVGSRTPPTRPYASLSAVIPNSIRNIPLAMAFTETVHAKFRAPITGSTSATTTATIQPYWSPHDLHTSGILTVSFPCMLLDEYQQATSNSTPNNHFSENLQLVLTQADRLRNVEPCKDSSQIISKIENPDDDTYRIHVNLEILCNYIVKMITNTVTTSPNQKRPPFINIQLVQYDVTNRVLSSGSILAPVTLDATWKFNNVLQDSPAAKNTGVTPYTSTSHLLVNYTLQWPHNELASSSLAMVRPATAMGNNNDSKLEISPRGEVRFIVTADGHPIKMQSLPPSVWNSELGRAYWRLDTEESSRSGTIKAKFFLDKTNALPQPVFCQFNIEGSIESGVTIQVLPSSQFRVSRLKYQLISGRYLWEPLINTTANNNDFCV